MTKVRGARVGHSVVLVGLGNIGSSFAGLLGKMPGVARVVLIDRDVYESKNLGSQEIRKSDVGRPKARAQAQRLRHLNPDLAVVPVVDDLIQVPLAVYRSDLIVAGLDSIAARIQLNEIAWRLGIPWVDAGVDPLQNLIRITALRPGEVGPCFECGLTSSDYLNLGTLHPCLEPRPEAFPTNGSASLGSVVGGLLAIECEKILDQTGGNLLWGRQLIFDPMHHRCFVSEIPGNPECRFDHSIWSPPRSLAVSLGASLSRLLEVARRTTDAKGGFSIEVPHHPLVQAVCCPGCGTSLSRPHLAGRIQMSCPVCRSPDLRPVGFETRPFLDASLPGATLRGSLRTLGFRKGDLIRVRSAKRDWSFVIAGDRT